MSKEHAPGRVRIVNWLPFYRTPYIKDDGADWGSSAGFDNGLQVCYVVEVYTPVFNQTDCFPL